MPACAHLVEARADAVLDDVLELDDAEHAACLRHDERRGAAAGDAVDDRAELGAAIGAAPLLDEAPHRVAGALAELAAVDVDAAHAGLGRERR